VTARKAKREAEEKAKTEADAKVAAELERLCVVPAKLPKDPVAACEEVGKAHDAFIRRVGDAKAVADWDASGKEAALPMTVVQCTQARRSGAGAGAGVSTIGGGGGGGGGLRSGRSRTMARSERNTASRVRSTRVSCRRGRGGCVSRASGCRWSSGGRPWCGRPARRGAARSRRSSSGGSASMSDANHCCGPPPASSGPSSSRYHGYSASPIIRRRYCLSPSIDTRPDGPVAKRSRSSASASAVGWRSAGRSASAFRMMRSSSGATPGRRVDGGGTSPLGDLLHDGIFVVAVEQVRQRHHSYSRMPMREHVAAAIDRPAADLLRGHVRELALAHPVVGDALATTAPWRCRSPPA
jgi:hypothetical protein